jgi:hypothetical protein
LQKRRNQKARDDNTQKNRVILLDDRTLQISFFSKKVSQKFFL